MVKELSRAEATSQLDAAREFAIEAARLAAHTRCHRVVVLDVSAISPVTDFLVIATGTSQRQMQTVCDEIEERGAATDFRALSRSEDTASNWSVIDFVHVVVHLFNQEGRMYYDLDSLWGDAKVVEWQDAQPAVTA